MKEKIIKIIKDNDTEIAAEKILVLFRTEDIDITRCPKCGSTDYTMITGIPNKCNDCGSIFL